MSPQAMGSFQSKLPRSAGRQNRQAVVFDLLVRHKSVAGHIGNFIDEQQKAGARSQTCT
jgi:hypothetical protein